MEDQAQIVDEIRQLCTQYQQEVPGRRRAWPKAIKSRVRELSAAGVRLKAISQQTGISYFTLHRWLSDAPKASTPTAAFQAVKVVATLPEPRNRDVATVTVKTRGKYRSKKVVTVTVTMPGGIRIEGATVGFLADLMQRLGLR